MFANDLFFNDAITLVFYNKITEKMPIIRQIYMLFSYCIFQISIINLSGIGIINLYE